MNKFTMAGGNKIAAILLAMTALPLQLLAQHGKPTWLDQMKSEHGRTRMAYGFKASDPTGLIVQLYKGNFCSGQDTYKHRGTVEFYAGLENLLFPRNSSYREGKLSSGGNQFGVNYQFPLFCFAYKKHFTLQLHAGPGLQAGKRRFDVEGISKETNTSGGTGIIRLSLTGRGFKMMNRYWFWSAFAEQRYYSEFGNPYSSWRPGLGIVLRKVR